MSKSSKIVLFVSIAAAAASIFKLGLCVGSNIDEKEGEEEIHLQQQNPLRQKTNEDSQNPDNEDEEGGDSVISNQTKAINGNGSVEDQSSVNETNENSQSTYECIPDNAIGDQRTDGSCLIDER